MNDKEFNNQMELISRHISKAQQCNEYGRSDDAEVHIMIADVLMKGLKAKQYEKESLDNLRSAVL